MKSEEDEITAATELYLRAWNLGDPNSGADHGYMLIKQGKLEEAQVVLWRLANEGNAFAINNLYLVSIATNDDSIASRLTKDNPKHVFPDFYEPFEKLLLGKKKEAIELLCKGISAGPNVSVWWLLEQLYCFGHKQLAFEVASEVPEEAWSGKLWLANFFRLEGKEVKELKKLSELKDLGYWLVQKRLAQLYAEKGDFVTAISLFEDSLALNADDFRFQNEIKEKIRLLKEKSDAIGVNHGRGQAPKPTQGSPGKANARKKSLN
jgi:tetratricopeptide (TPR) repeat protein